MTPGFVLALVGAAIYAVIAFGGREAPKALLVLAWTGMALWTAGTVVWACWRLLVSG